MDVLVTYDIDTTDKEGERLLTRVARVCEGYGVRVQYSVFECRLTTTSLARMTVDLQDLIRPDRDSVRIYRFPGQLTDARKTLGRRRYLEIDQLWML
jgi:CRISPR-associated protein Cas2